MVAAQPLAVVFFGTPAFAAPTLQALLHSRHAVVGVVLQPDRPRGRGQKPSIGPVKELALDAGLPVLQPERLKDPAFLHAFAALGADLGVVAAYGRILPEVVINTPRLGLINVHGSLLPRYRGAAPIQRAVMAGDHETGITIMRIVKELDAGPMFAKVVRPIPLEATSGDIERDLAEVGARLLVKVVESIAAGTAREEPQDDAHATYAPKITREESPIDWTRPAAAIHNQVRALNPWPRASTSLDGARLIVIRTIPEEVDNARSLEPEAWSLEPLSVEPGLQSRRITPGTVINATGDAIRVATGDGVLLILAVQPEGRRVMTAREFLAGRPIPAGTRLS
jgi:methionyl-tRNA formyltransferase